jgi:hypothetical protein
MPTARERRKADMPGRGKRAILLCGLVSLMIVSAGCGSSEMQPGSVGLLPVSALEGTWYGAMEDASVSLHTLQVTMLPNGTTTAERADGGATGVTHAFSTVPRYPRIFSFSGSDGSSGSMYVDRTATYALFVDSNAAVGVLQKGATALPAYIPDDILGTWSGFEVEIDANYALMTAYLSDLGLIFSNPDYIFSGINRSGSIGGFVTSYHPSYGWYEGPQLLPASGVLRFMLSADKTFAGGYSCLDTDTWPQDCSFFAWKRQ